MVTNFLTKNKLKSIHKLFEKNVKEFICEIVNAQDTQGYTPIHIASYHGDFNFIQYLKNLGGDVNIIDEKLKKEALDFAANNLVRRTLVDINDAAKNGDQKSLNLLLNSGIQIDSRASINGLAPIHKVFFYFISFNFYSLFFLFKRILKKFFFNKRLWNILIKLRMIVF